MNNDKIITVPKTGINTFIGKGLLQISLNKTDSGDNILTLDFSKVDKIEIEIDKAAISQVLDIDNMEHLVNDNVHRAFNLIIKDCLASQALLIANENNKSYEYYYANSNNSHTGDDTNTCSDDKYNQIIKNQQVTMEDVKFIKDFVVAFLQNVK